MQTAVPPVLAPTAGPFLSAVRSFFSISHTFAPASAISQIRDSIVVSISACHAEDPGSIPGRGNSSAVPIKSAAGARWSLASLCLFFLAVVYEVERPRGAASQRRLGAPLSADVPSATCIFFFWAALLAPSPFPGKATFLESPEARGLAACGSGCALARGSGLGPWRQYAHWVAKKQHF